MPKMPKIQVLSQEVADKIAAGEVAERPSAVVKELVENAIDAGATSIEVEIRKGGVEYIRVCDNGCGIEPDQAETAFLRHATSKLKTIDDLYSIGTMGFRGEALSSICAVAEVFVITRTKDNDEGIFLRLNHGKTEERGPIAAPCGTTMVVERLFENIPARMKFLKKDSTEAGYVADVVGRIALSMPQISFTYICDDKEVFSTSGDGSLKNAVLKLYGIDHARAVIPVDYTEDNVRVSGLTGKPELSRGNRTRQTIFVNGRYIKSHVLSKIVGEAYRNSVMVGKFPFFVLDISIPPECVDVNVHPAKTEIKFANENRVYEIVYHAVSNALSSGEVKPESQEAQALQKTTPVSNTEKTIEKTEKIDRKIVREYLDSIIPPKKEEIPRRENSDFIYKDFNFLDTAAEGKYEIREIDEGPGQRLTKQKTEEKPKEVLAPVPKAIGQVFDTYIVCQSGDVFYMIDQHAAHERLRFEVLKKSYYGKEKMSQLLLTPMILRPDYSELQTILSSLDTYENFGFEIGDFGSGSIIVTATPIIADEPHIRDLILEIADAISTTGRHSIADFEERALDMIACKYAIKANHKLNAAEMQDLINKVWQLQKGGICTCPHGRPIKIEFSKEDIEKLFKRRL